ncbi:MAG TPA: hypothetical protein VK540_15895 [Polyangiaceae bacterium]|nr:hypothetical protein [Polyangiaceae bacterium]
MPEHRSHGRPRAQPPRYDELPAGIPAPEQGQARQERTPDGKLLPGASTIPSLGGKALKGRTALSHRIDSETIPSAYRKRARSHRRATCAELARDFGGGQCGVMASTFVRIGSVAIALAEESLDSGNREEWRKQSALAMSALNYAREHAATAATSRPKYDGKLAPWFIEVDDDEPDPAKGGSNG